MAYIESNDIYMFPVANRGESFPLSRLTTEQNIVNILKSMSDKDGFVISSTGIYSPSSGAYLEFIIDGYYVKTSYESIPTGSAEDPPADRRSTGDTLYAHIVVEKYGSDICEQNQELITQESSNNSEGRIDLNQGGNDSYFTALSFTWESSAPSPTTNECIIPLLYFNGTNYIIKEEYRYKIDRNSIDNQWIDLTQ